MESHKHLFVGEDVESDLDPEVLEAKKIHAPEAADIPMNIILPWAVDIILDEVKRRHG